MGLVFKWLSCRNLVPLYARRLWQCSYIMQLPKAVPACNILVGRQSVTQPLPMQYSPSQMPPGFDFETHKVEIS